MHSCVCMHVYGRACVCMHVYGRSCVCMHVYGCSCVCMHVYGRACVCAPPAPHPDPQYSQKQSKPASVWERWLGGGLTAWGFN